MKRLALAAFAVIPLLVGFVWPGTVEWFCTRGVRQYEQKQYVEAGESFSRALEADPDSGTLMYNRGTALFRQDRFDEAGESLEKAARASSGEDARDAWYNLGNSRYRAQDFAGAVEAYKESLRIDAADNDARRNLELAQRKLDEEQDQQQNQDQQDDDKQQEQDEQQQEQQDPNEQQQEQQEEQEQDQQQQPQEQEGQQTPQSGQQPQSGADVAESLSPEQARRLLHALASQDAEMQRIIRRSPERRQPERGEKDW